MKEMFTSVFMITALFVGSAFAGNVDLEKSVLDWEGTKVTGKHHGKIKFKDADVQLKDGSVVGGKFVVDMNTISVEDLEGEWATKFLGHMKSKDFFTVETYPTAKLVIKSVNAGKAVADLTIKDKTNEVVFDIKKEDQNYSGVLVFDRTKFNMIYGSGDFFKGLGDKMIHNDVKVKFKFIVKK